MSSPAPDRVRLAVVGIGNPLAGDDGVGAEAVARLRPRWASADQLLLEHLEGDLFAVTDILERAQQIVFVDAVIGDSPGELVVRGESRRAFAPSLHQTDMAAVMWALQQLQIVEPFPGWEIWGVVITPPTELGEGLSPLVAAGVANLVELLSDRIARELGEG